MGYTVAEREKYFRQFIKLRAAGYTKRDIERRIGIREKTYYKWCRTDDSEEQFLTLPRTGGPKLKTTEEDDESLRAVALENNWSNLNVLRQLPEIEGNERLTTVTDQTAGNILRAQGVRHRIAAIKEKLREAHKERRLNYAGQLVNWTLIDWSRGIFLDEFTYCTGDGGQSWVWRESGTRYDERNIHFVQRTERFSVTFIACFSFHGMGPIYRVNRLNRESYIDFLENHLYTYIDTHFDDGKVFLLHDNHPVHTLIDVKRSIEENIGEA